MVKEKIPVSEKIFEYLMWGCADAKRLDYALLLLEDMKVSFLVASVSSSKD
jgi:hypothetical protein